MIKNITLVTLFCLITFSTIAKEREYKTWGSVSYQGGVQSIVPYPTRMAKIRREKVNNSSYGKYLSFSVWLKTESVEKQSFAFIQIFDGNGKIINSESSIRVKGTTGWKKYSTPKVHIPYNAERIVVGVSLHGVGKVEFHDGIIK